MRKGRYLVSGLVLTIVASSILVSGCAVNFYKQSPRSKKKIEELKGKIDDLERQRMEEQARFEAVKEELQRRLRDQIADDQISLKMRDGGLVIILSDSILFDSGKAEVKKSAYPVLNKVIDVVKKKVPDKNVGVYGHTDNVPIKVSGWKSNWELSTARATNVLHYLESKGIPPKRLSATGYGEYRPVASNATAAGRAKNRRVEIVILPEFEEQKEDAPEGQIK